MAKVRLKLKPHKGLMKRIKITKHGKIKRHRAGTGHLLSHKSAKRRRRLRKAVIMKPMDAKRIKKMLGI